MKIALFSRFPARELQPLLESIGQAGFLCTVVGAERKIDPETMALVCYGGDGTLLEGIRLLEGREIPVVGINSGHLGFLTSTPEQGIAALFEQMRAGKLRYESRSMLAITGDFGAGTVTHYAVNEVCVQRQGAGMISIDTYVDDQMVATYHGDGLIVSTPTGSTAYSLSVGGPVVSPGCACLVLSPVAPHNLTMRPVVIPDTGEVRLHARARQSHVAVSIDNQIHSVARGTTFTVRRADRRFLLAVAHDLSFYDTLRNKMMWGVDIRS